jgi:hypothetical protein
MKLPKRLPSLPSSVRFPLRVITSLVLGLAIACSLHYILYRIGLPSKPFIYVAF